MLSSLRRRILGLKLSSPENKSDVLEQVTTIAEPPLYIEAIITSSEPKLWVVRSTFLHDIRVPGMTFAHE